MFSRISVDHQVPNLASGRTQAGTSCRPSCKEGGCRCGDDIYEADFRLSLPADVSPDSDAEDGLDRCFMLLRRIWAMMNLWWRQLRRQSEGCSHVFDSSEPRKRRPFALKCPKVCGTGVSNWFALKLVAGGRDTCHAARKCSEERRPGAMV